MSHFGRVSALILIPAIFAIAGCEGAPDADDSGAQAPSDVLDAAPTTPDPLCQINGTNAFWIAKGTTTITCPSSCSDGSMIQCNVVLEEEVDCVNGVVTPMGPTQTGEVISPIGSCTSASADCGTHPNGSIWWVNTGTANTACDPCSDGTPHTCVINTQTQYQCQNGVAATTGQTQNGSIISYSNDCSSK